MPIDAHAVASTVDEIFAVSRIGNHVARGRVDLLRLHPGACRLERGPYGLIDYGMDLVIAFGWAADCSHAGDVAGKTPLTRSDVDNDGITLGEFPLSD